MWYTLHIYIPPVTRVLSSTKILINSGAAFVSSHFQDFVLFNILDSGNNSGEFDHHDTEFIIRPKDYYISTNILYFQTMFSRKKWKVGVFSRFRENFIGWKSWCSSWIWNLDIILQMSNFLHNIYAACTATLFKTLIWSYPSQEDLLVLSFLIFTWPNFYCK